MGGGGVGCRGGRVCGVCVCVCGGDVEAVRESFFLFFPLR